MTAEEHYLKACSIADASCIPSFRYRESCLDLTFAATQTVSCAKCLAESRRATTAAVKELADRCKPLTEQLRQFQPPSVAIVTAGINLGLVCMLVVAMQWPDSNLPRRMTSGFATTGTLEETYFFAKVTEATAPSFQRQDLFLQAPCAT